MPLGLCVLPALLLLLAAGSAGEDVYSWTDATGVAHYTNDPSTIPQRYRDKARTLDGQPASSASTAAQPPPAESKAGAGEETPKAIPAKPSADRLEESEDESAPPPLSPGAAEKLSEAGWRKRFQTANERLRRAELTLGRDKEQLSRVANEEGYMVVDAYGRTMTAGRSTALRMQVAEDERVAHDARDALDDLERAAAREAIPLEWRR
jgi:hypothetical protein